MAQPIVSEQTERALDGIGNLPTVWKLLRDDPRGLEVAGFFDDAPHRQRAQEEDILGWIRRESGDRLPIRLIMLVGD